MAVTRRDALVLVGAAAAFAGLNGLVRWHGSSVLAFEPAPGLPGFRRIAEEGGSISAASFLLSPSGPRGVLPKGAQLCQIAFAGDPGAVGTLTIASFSDFFCPYCRILDVDLRKIADADPRVSVVWHQVPLLGPSSRLAARGAMAAANQGAFARFQTRLLHTMFVPTRSYLQDFAQREGLDVPRFLADLDAPDTEARLAASLAAFDAFGFVGTPGMAVGRTLINGAISPARLRELVDIEIDLPAPTGCRE